MHDLKLLVVGSVETVNLFSLLGAEGLVVAHKDELKKLVLLLEERSSEIGGVLIDGDLFDEDSRQIRKLQSFDVPFVYLPSGEAGAEAGYKKLELLTERAMGMKLKVD